VLNNKKASIRTIVSKEKNIEEHFTLFSQNANSKQSHKTLNRTITLHHDWRAITSMSRTDFITSEQTVDIMEERRIHRIPLTCTSHCRDVRSRKDLIIFIKTLLDDLEKSDPVLRTQTAEVSDKKSCLNYSILHSMLSHALSSPFQAVRECVLRNRQGQPGYTPLVPVVQRRVQDIIGEARWIRTIKSAFKTKKRAQQPMNSVDTADYPTAVARV
jgi:hypothetical protein